MEKVSTFYWKIRENLGKHIASEFYRLMKDWDGSTDVGNAFYDEGLLEIKLKEAKEKF